jgi:uncharacterized protein (DUF2235 family)
MPKNIVICADGTGNTTVKDRGTNVFKLFEAVDANGHRIHPALTQQVAIYHDGVGTESLKWLRLFTGATGWGLSRNVKQLYGELARVYQPGDRIFVFGFSRGAFTVRTLAGLINTCGILDVSQYGSNSLFQQGILDTYKQYRRKYQTWLSRVLRGDHTKKPEPKALQDHHYVKIPGFDGTDPPVIHFIGVWDTVDAVGLPLHLSDLVNTFIWRFKFPDTKLSKKVGHACHALAIDEARRSFAPVLWDEEPEDRSKAPRIEQVWFAGAHSNVGGGYPRQGMSLTALDWMMTRAEAHGLRFHADVRAAFRGLADANDKRYDSRAGLGVFYRWTPRDIEQLCAVCHVTPQVHRTVFERIARNTEGYAPGSLPTRCQIVSTSAKPDVRDRLAAIVAEAFHPGPPLLRRTKSRQLFGQAGYALMILTTLIIAWLMLAKYVEDSRLGAPNWRQIIAGLADNAVSSHWLSVVASTVWHYPWVPILAAASLTLLVWTDHRLDTYYSSFWHRIRDRLRLAM